MSKTTVYFIILNWNRPNDTIGCLKSVKGLSSSKLEFKVTVVDNASQPHDITLLKKHISSEITLIENKKNLGFTGGNNVGIKFALENGADYVVILNNDVTLHPESMIQIIKTMERDSSIGLASPKIYFSKGFEFHKSRYKESDLGNVIWYGGGVIDWNNVYGSARGVDEVDIGQYDKIEGTDFATGACMVMSKKLLEKVGIFDEKYFLYYEDTDFSVRAKRFGFKVMYVPSAIAWHKVAQSSGIGSGLNDYYTTRNRMLFGIKYASLRTKFALFRDSIKLLLNGRPWQKRGILDFYTMNFGKGSWK